MRLEAEGQGRILDRHEEARPGPEWDGYGIWEKGMWAQLLTLPSSASISWSSLLASFWGQSGTQERRIRRHLTASLISSGW